MARRNIEYNENFDKYVEMIVAHPHYKGLYYDRSEEGKVNWVVAGKSAKGQKRKEWWDNTCKRLGIPLDKGCYAKAARIIHPTKRHVCQCCGKELSIMYEYPTLRILPKINALLGTSLSQSDMTIGEIIDKYCDAHNISDICNLLNIPVQKNKTKLSKYVYKELVDKESPMLSPGVMSNPPDRFDGFHSYGICCRKTKDTGRHDENMKTYTQDRRAYEDWADGDFNLANRLMGEFHKAKPMACPICGHVEVMSADHIGPISLGFCHSTHFAPMCTSCNSAKNNRFTKHDVDTLMTLEKKGEQVISWHSKYIWDKLKKQIKTGKDAQLASSIMAKCHQTVLYVFSLIHKETGRDFLRRYLHPEYALVDYRFRNFDINHLDRMEIVSKPLVSKNKEKNMERSLRIAFESLDEFSKKENRKNQYAISVQDRDLREIIATVQKKQYGEADKKLRELIERVADEIYFREWK